MVWTDWAAPTEVKRIRARKPRVRIWKIPINPTVLLGPTMDLSVNSAEHHNDTKQFLHIASCSSRRETMTELPGSLKNYFVRLNQNEITVRPSRSLVRFLHQ